MSRATIDSKEIYSQLIDDYDQDIQVIQIDGEKESLTNYIVRMGGVVDDE